MQQGIPHAQIERFNSAGHFIMLDDPARFTATLINFLNNEAASQ